MPAKIKCTVKNLDRAIKDAVKNAEENGGRFVTMVASTASRGLAINATVPLGRSQKGSGKLKSGEGSLTKDIFKAAGGNTRIYRTVAWHDQRKASQVLAVMKKGRIKAAESIARKTGAQLTFHQRFNPTFHQSARRNGRVSKFTGIVTPDARGRERYRKQTAKHIGRAKAGWLMGSGSMWVTKMPKWIERHGRIGRYYQNGLKITIINPVPYASDAMVQSMVPNVILNAIKATNYKMNAERRKKKS